MNGKAIGDTIQDLASSVANSKWGKAVIPTTDELNRTISGNTRLAGSLYDEKIQKSLGRMFAFEANIPDLEAVKMAKNVTAKNYDKAIESLSDDIVKYADKPVDKVIQRAKDVVKKEISKGIDADSLSIPDKVMKYSAAYFMNPDKQIRNTRKATVAAAYAGTAIGGRYLTGGTLTTDKYGRKDIAGVPFL